MAEVNIKSILLGMVLVVLVATIYSLMITDFTSKYNMEENATQNLAFVNKVAASNPNGTIEQYSDLLFEAGSEDASTFDFIEFMWKGTWKVLSQTVELPGKVAKVMTASLDTVGLGANSQGAGIRNAILIALASVLAIVIIFAVINMIKGASR